MPELPEVESIRLQLEKYLVGHTIEEVEINYEKCFQGEPEDVEGGKVKKIRRFGKVLVIDLDNGFSLVIHIKLTGQLIYRGPNLENPPDLSEKVKEGLEGKHTHVIFHLDRDGRLYYNDVRKFGWIKVVKSSKLKIENEFIKNLGPEPLADYTNSPQEKLTLDKFKELTNSTSRYIKTLLMDQSKIGGVGNIYTNDALFLAKIHPESKSSSLSLSEVERLYKAIEKVLKKGLEAGGASELAFVTPDGTEGTYQDYTLVYGKEGEPCPDDCGGKIEKIKVSGRGTYFCPKCQK